MEAAFQQGFASALLDVLFSRVTDVFIIELKKIKNVDEAVQKLQITILEAKELLRKIDLSQFQGNDMLIQVLKKRVVTLTTLGYDADDVMDEIALMIAKRCSESGTKTWRIRDVILRSLRTWSIPNGINKLQEKMNGILEQLKDLTTMTVPTNGCTMRLEGMKLEGPLIEAHSHQMQMSLVGRDNDVQAIVEHLLSCGFNSGVSVIGMVGLGKTALAQTIMSDARIVSEFSVRIWIPVLNGCFNMKDSIDKLTNFFPLTKGVQVKSGEADSSKLNLVLKQRKTLIIFDNLLEVKYLDWDYFWSAIKDIGETKLLVTTRDPRISKLTGTTPYYLRSLSDESCKSVIMNKAASHNYEISVRPHFSQVASILATKCEGLPLVARIIGLVLAKCDEDEWNNLSEEDLWEWPVFKDEILPLLNSCYEDMQSDMKNCFAFFSLFPSHHRFTLDDLVQLWVGAGFIQQSTGLSSLEKIGRTHLEYLLGRSIIQFSDDVTQIERARFVLHRFNQRFAQLAGSKTFKRLDEGVSTLTSLSDDIRHLSLFCDNIQPIVWSHMRALKRLCTILSLYDHNRIGRLGKIPPYIFKTLERLRVLALSNTDVDELPDSIDKLKHLRYLDVSNTPISKFPETVSKLYGLQILKFGNTPSLFGLPKDLHNLSNLLFLDWDITDIVRLGIPCNIGKLSSLQNLPLYQVGEKAGQFITELKDMNCLQGSIIIKNLDNVKDGEEAKTAMLDKKKKLKKIELQWNSSRKDSIAKEVSEGLKPPFFLKELKITRYGNNVFPEWISHPFPMLEKIHLLRCHACTIFPELGQLPVLKVLILQEMSGLTFFDTSMHGTPANGTVENFPSLELLEFNKMAKLHDLAGLQMKSMSKLHELKFIECPAMVNFPSIENLTSLVDIQIECCQALESLSRLPTCLKSIVIMDCPRLQDECQVGGKEWIKIDAIPNVEIDYKKILTSGVSNPSSSTS